MRPDVGFESIGGSRTGIAVLRDSVILLAAMVILLAGMALAPSGMTSAASAGEYSVWSCRGPDGAPLTSEAWRPRTWNAGVTEFNLVDDCSAGGSLRAVATDLGLGPRSQAWATFDLPRGDEITGYTIWRYLYAPSILGGTYISAIRETASGSTVDNGCASTLLLPNFNCSASGSASDPLNPFNEYSRPVVSLDGLDIYTGCFTNGCPATVPFAGPSFRLFRSAVRIADNAAPSVISIGGTVVGPEPVSGKASVTVSGSDAGGGIRSIGLRLDGVPVDAGAPNGSPVTCSTPYPVPRPCLAGAARTFTFDTGPMSPGIHSASGTIVDAAGNSTDWGPVDFTVADPVPPPPLPDNGNPASASPRLTMDRGTVDHQASRPAAIRGRLRTGSGGAISGAVLGVKMVTISSTRQTERKLASVVTGPDGRFRIPVKGGGAKQITASYSPFLGGVPVASATAMARARITLKLKRRPARVKRGKKVTFRGSLAGGGTAVSRANVEIQAIVGGRWRAIANVQARRNGTFVWPYRFRYVERDALFSFRAVVRRTLGWPWPTLKSKRVKVRVNGAR